MVNTKVYFPIPGNKTVETEMTSGEVIEFEKDWKKLWHPTMTQGQSANHE